MSKNRAAPAAGAKTLSELVADFRERLGPEGDMEAGYMEWMRAAPDYEVAVRRAVLSIKPNGKMHNHQSRVPKDSIHEFVRVLLEREEDVRSSLVDFRALFRRIEELRPWGIGPVTTYDVAQRLGEFLLVFPMHVHMHAGPREGAAALGIVRRRGEWVRVDEFPSALHGLNANELEDFLCVYRELFKGVRHE